MKNGRSEFTLIERFMVVAIILFLAVVAARNAMDAVEVSEERTVRAAATEYSALRSTYTKMYRAPSSTGGPPDVPAP